MSLLSHELRTPLMGIINAITAAQSASDSKEWFEIAQRSARSLAQRLDEVLSLAAIEGGALHPRSESLLLGGWLERYCQDSKIGFENLDGSPVWVNADSDLLKQLLQALSEWLSSRGGAVQKIRCLNGEVALFCFFESPTARSGFTAEWKEAAVARKARVVGNGSVFGRAVVSERDFLNQSASGFEMAHVLVFEIARALKIELSMREEYVVLLFHVPSQETLLKSALNEQLLQAQRYGNPAAFVLVDAPSRELRKKLLEQRSRGDRAFELPTEVAFLLRDCVAEEASWVVSRMEKTLGPLKVALVTVPGKSWEASQILTEARSALRYSSRSPT